MKTLSILALVLLTGCSTVPGTFSNRLACTVAKDKAFYVSMYGPVGVASKIDDIDAAAICRG